MIVFSKKNFESTENTKFTFGFYALLCSSYKESIKKLNLKRILIEIYLIQIFGKFFVNFVKKINKMMTKWFMLVSICFMVAFSGQAAAPSKQVVAEKTFSVKPKPQKNKQLRKKNGFWIGLGITALVGLGLAAIFTTGTAQLTAIVLLASMFVVLLGFSAFLGLVLSKQKSTKT